MKRPLAKMIEGMKQFDAGIKKICGIVEDFCSNSNVHGIRYFTERQRHWSERLFWIVTVALSMYFCCYSIREIVIDWHQNPVKLGFTDKPVSISSIPFPAVTICPTVIADSRKLDANSLDEFMERSDNSPDASESMRVLAYVISSSCFKKFRNVTNELENGNILRILQEFSPSPSEIFNYIHWKLDQKSFNECFVSILTPYGICYTFNELNPNEMYTKQMSADLMVAENIPNLSHWDADNGYDSGVIGRIYPRRISNAIPMGALQLGLRQYKKVGLKCSNDGAVAFRLYLHSPGEIPHLQLLNLKADPSEHTYISIKPSLITTSDGLRSYTPDQRQCFFNYERRLQFYQIYTQRNCIEECFSNYLKAKFGCVFLNMPRDNETNICTNKHMNQKHIYKMVLQFHDGIDDISDGAIQIFRKNCNCLPSCTSIVYDAEVNRYGSIQSMEDDEFQLLDVSFYFKTQEVTTLQRTEMYTFSSFLAIGGGLLGLFLGISLLSIVELIYYFTLRLFWNIRQWKRDAVQPNRAKIIHIVPEEIAN